jgi:hypothetical protein
MSVDPFASTLTPEMIDRIAKAIEPIPNGCRCTKPIRNPHLKATGQRHTCARCLKPMNGTQLEKARLAQDAPRAHGTSAHRQARVEKFTAAQRRKAEKRKRAKRNRR